MVYLCKFVRDFILIFNRGAINCRLRNDFKGRGLKMGVFIGGEVDLDLDFQNFWDGVYNFFFLPPPPPPRIPGRKKKTKYNNSSVTIDTGRPVTLTVMFTEPDMILQPFHV